MSYTHYSVIVVIILHTEGAEVRRTDFLLSDFLPRRAQRLIPLVTESAVSHTPNLPTNIMDFRGFYSNIILTLRGGIPRPIGDFPESLSQVILVGIIHVSREIGRMRLVTESAATATSEVRHVYIYIYIYTHVLRHYACIHMYIYIYIYIERERYACIII